MKDRSTSVGQVGSPRSRSIVKLTTPVLAAAMLFLASCGDGGQQQGQQEQQGGATQQGGGSAMQGGGSTAMQGGTTMAQGGTTMGGTTMGGTTMGGTTMAQGGTTMGGTTMGQSATQVSAIIANPARYYGPDVEVRGGVAQVIELRAFVMMDQEDLRGSVAIPEATITDRGLLVINTSGTNPTFSERQGVWASGDLQPFDVATVEQDLGVDLDDDLYTEYEDRPVILADQVRPQQGGSTQMETTGQ